MLEARHKRILLDVLTLPTAPFLEGRIHTYIKERCDALPGVSITEDAAGNILARYRRGARTPRRPVCLTAHTDHPGFVAERMTGPGRLRAVWRGGVKPDFFQNARVRFHADGRWTRGRIETVRTTGRGGQRRVKTVSVAVTRPVPPGAIGMWDLPDAAIRNGRVYARGCDDLAGVAGMLGCLDTLARRKTHTEIYCLFTRAEEVGFVGALAACRRGTIPRKCVVVAIETSSELPSARMGDGPILRVGDKTTTYFSPATSHCQAVADELARTDRKFRYQRKLMDGGTCESTAYCQFEYEATGICLALGNYHNMNLRTGRIGSEYVNLADFENLLKWFVALGTSRLQYQGRNNDLRNRLRKIEQEYASLLRRTRAAAVTGKLP